MSDAQASEIRKDRLPRTGFLLLAFISLFWGANWPAMKIVLWEVPVWWFRAMCVWAGAIGLLSIAKASGTSLRIKPEEVRPMLWVSLFAILCWQVFSAYGISLMPAGRAAIIAFTMPVWASFLGAYLLNEPITGPKIAGLVFGLTGLAVLMGEDLAVFDKAPLGALFMLAAAATWAVGTVFFKKFRWTTPVVVLAGWQLFASAIPITLVALAIEPVPDLTALSTPAIVSLFYVFVLPMIFCQWAYFKVVSIFPASIAAIGTLAVPIVGVYSSALVLGEPVGWRELAALILICLALTSVMVIPALKRGN